MIRLMLNGGVHFAAGLLVGALLLTSASAMRTGRKRQMASDAEAASSSTSL